MGIGDHDFWEQIVQKILTEVRKQENISAV